MHCIEASSPYKPNPHKPRLIDPSPYNSNPKIPSPQKPSRAYSAAIAGITLIVLAACSGDGPERTERFPYINEPNFQVENPSRDRASATGIGCGGTEKEALVKARETARFNLRGVTGNSNYQIRYSVLEEIPKESSFCLKVKATAVDAA